MARFNDLTEVGLQQLERALSPSATPPPPEPRFTPVDIELRNVSNLMYSLGRYTKGLEYIKQNGITKTSSLYGIRCHGVEPNLEELKHLTTILQKKYEELRPKEELDDRLRRLKQEVLNTLLRLFQLGNQGHWVLAEERDVQIQDYTSDPILKCEGRDSANPDWWEEKLARLVERLEQAENNTIRFTTAPAEAIDELYDQLSQQRRLFRRLGSISVGDWVQNITSSSKRSFDMDDSEDLQSPHPAKRRKPAESLCRKPQTRNQTRASAKGCMDSVGKSSTMREVSGVQLSRFGRVLRRPDRYGFPNLTRARKQGR